MDTVTLTIDGQRIEVDRNLSVLEAAEQAGIYIPHLCFIKGLPPYNGCRMCTIEVEGARYLDLACTARVAQDMVVQTQSKRVRDAQRKALMVILSEHAERCGVCLTCERLEHCEPFMACNRQDTVTERCVLCPKNKRCELQKVAETVDLRGQRRLFSTVQEMTVDTRHPFVQRDPNRCILCARCVRVCADVRGVGAIHVANRGNRAVVMTDFDVPLQETNCESCGACIAVCPTGALVDRPSRFRGQPDYTVTTTCPYCGVGCGLDLEVKNGKIIRVNGDEDSVVNHGQLCVKGRFGYDFVQSEERLKTPLIRKNGKLEEASWDEALTLIADKLGKYKGDSFAMVASAKATNEDNYVMQKFARVVMGTNNVDHCARL